MMIPETRKILRSRSIYIFLSLNPFMPGFFLAILANFGVPVLGKLGINGLAAVQLTNDLVFPELNIAILQILGLINHQL